MTRQHEYEHIDFCFYLHKKTLFPFYSDYITQHKFNKKKFIFSIKLINFLFSSQILSTKLK